MDFCSQQTNGSLLCYLSVGASRFVSEERAWESAARDIIMTHLPSIWLLSVLDSGHFYQCSLWLLPVFQSLQCTSCNLIIFRLFVILHLILKGFFSLLWTRLVVLQLKLMKQWLSLVMNLCAKKIDALAIKLKPLNGTPLSNQISCHQLGHHMILLALTRLLSNVIRTRLYNGK
jgi:hypothetical protein